MGYVNKGRQVLQELQDSKVLQGNEAKKVQCHGYIFYCSLFFFEAW